MAQKPKTLQELRALSKPLLNINIESQEKLNKLDRLAFFITKKVGSPGFFFFIFFLTLFLIGFYIFISNMIQILLMPLIMVGQNLQGRHAEFRAEADFEVNTKAELEIETILLHLERQNELILKILNHLENEKGSKNVQ